MVPVGLAGLATSTPGEIRRQVARHRLEAVLGAGGDAHGLEVERAQDVAVARIAGLADRHLLAALEEAGEGEDEGRRGARRHHDPARDRGRPRTSRGRAGRCAPGAPAGRAPPCSRAAPPPSRRASAARAAAGAGVPGWPTSMWITVRPRASSARAASITSITMKGSTSPRLEVRTARSPKALPAGPSATKGRRMQPAEPRRAHPRRALSQSLALAARRRAGGGAGR